MAGIQEVADADGVSTATVSRALSGNGHVSDTTKARVASAAAQLGYVVSSNASSLASGRTKNIGVVIPFLNRWFYSSVLEGAESSLLSHGYDLTLYNLTGGLEARRSVFEHFLLRQRVDAASPAKALALRAACDDLPILHRIGPDRTTAKPNVFRSSWGRYAGAFGCANWAPRCCRARCCCPARSCP